MTPLLATLGLCLCGPLAIVTTGFTLIKAMLDIEAHCAAQDIARITGGWSVDEPQPEPEPEPEPLRRIAWEVDEERVRWLLWPTDELAQIRAKVLAGAR